MSAAYPRLVAAAVQAAPVILNTQATLAKLQRLVEASADQGAHLIVLPEAFVSIYPTAPVFGAVFGQFFSAGASLAFRRLAQGAIEVPGPSTEVIGRAARKARAYVCVGVNERTATGTLHCTLLLFGPSGDLLQIRRKLVPTHDERMIWGPGDGAPPQVVPTEYGPVGQLVCWENYMPLARFALLREGERIHLAPTADTSDSWQTTIRHIALEGRVFVVSCNQYVTRAMYPADFELQDALRTAPEVLCRGGSAIVAPDGRYVAGPLFGEEGILIAELDLGEVAAGRQTLDVAGHYHRPDVFRLVTAEDPGQRRSAPYAR